MTHPQPYFSFIIFWIEWNPTHAIEGYYFILFSFRFLTDFSVWAIRAVILFSPSILVMYRSKSHAPTDIGGYTHIYNLIHLLCFLFFIYLSFVRIQSKENFCYMFQHAWAQYVTRNLVTHTLALRHAHSGIHTASLQHKDSLCLHLTCSHTLWHYCSLILWHYCTH